MTSFGATPKRRRIARTSSIDRVTRTCRRAPVPETLSDEPGAGGSSVCTAVRASEGSARSLSGDVATRAGASTSRAPSTVRSIAPRASLAAR